MSDKITRLPVARAPRDLMIVRAPPSKRQHLGVTFEYDEQLSEVTCGGCGAKLNPIWVIQQLGLMESRWVRARKFYLQAQEDFKKRVRTKCEHCQKITRIRGLS